MDRSQWEFPLKIYKIFHGLGQKNQFNDRKLVLFLGRGGGGGRALGTISFTGGAEIV